jgi:hemerythrin superfamily protein
MNAENATAGRVARFAPSITNMIRMDHSHVLALLRRYQPNTSPTRKSALVANACLALEVHAQLEEEIFYPALQAAGVRDDVLQKSVPEHNEMRRLIGTLRATDGGGGQDTAFRSLMRVVLHHVADEETVLLPRAEEILSDRLGELGAQMTKRRLQLLRPHLGEVGMTAAQSFPMASALAAVGALALGLAASKAIRGRQRGLPDRPLSKASSVALPR